MGCMPSSNGAGRSRATICRPPRNDGEQKGPGTVSAERGGACGLARGFALLGRRRFRNEPDFAPEGAMDVDLVSDHQADADGEPDEAEAEAIGTGGRVEGGQARSEEHTSELQSRFDLVCRLLLEKKK